MLTVNLDPEIRNKGSFKTAHPGEIQIFEGSDPLPFAGNKVCVKQVFQERENGTGLVRMRGRHELDAFSAECNCLVWASILLDLTYRFVDREVKLRGEPESQVPTLRFTRVMIAIVQNSSLEKAFLIEEWIRVDGDIHFTKYLNNHLPSSRVPPSAPPETHKIAEFLIFAQHLQYEKSQFSAFTSDYQGAGELLTDPQITSNPYVWLVLLIIYPSQRYFTSEYGDLFGDGNIPIAFDEFRNHHQCNYYCKFFGLTLLVPTSPDPSPDPQ
jgi:hypothetical protein